MLLWMPVESLSDGGGGVGTGSSSSSTISSSGNSNPLFFDHDEKGGKVRRQEQARRRAYKNAIACASSVALVFLVTILQAHSPVENAGQLLRSHRAARERATRLLPANSIYRLVVPDAAGNDFDLSQFAGRVTLVVNTACK
jgi:hypothetical protein